MILQKAWKSFNLSAATMGSTLTLDDLPRQYPIRRILLTFVGDLTITAGGTTDYVTNVQFAQSFIKRLKFKLGASNVLKSMTGYQCWIQNSLWHPHQFLVQGPDEGVTMAPAYNTPVVFNLIIDFADPSTIQGDSTILVPKLYEDLSLEVEFNELTDIGSGGDRPFTLTGTFNSMLILDTNLRLAPTDLLKEWTETKDVTSSGPFDFDLPRSSVIQQINIYPTERDQITASAIFNLASDDNFQIDIESGTFFLIDADMFQMIYNAVIDMEAQNTIQKEFFIPVDLNPLRDMADIVNPTSPLFKKWTARFPVLYPGATDPRIENHYTGRISNVLQR